MAIFFACTLCFPVTADSYLLGFVIPFPIGDLERTGQDGVETEQAQSWVPLAPHQQHGDGTPLLALPRYYLGAT